MNWLKGLINKGNSLAGAGEGTRQLEVADGACMTKAKIWAVGGGKGGVGKSLLAANLGVLLTRRGNKTLLVDADLGAANLHTFMGVEGSRISLSSFLKGEISELKTLVTRTRVPNLELISGAKDSLDVADLKAEVVSRLRHGLRELEYDYILLDIGPGTSSNMLDLFLMADEGVIVTTPEPTSVENTYRFLKCLLLRRMRNIIHSHKDSRLKDLLKTVLGGRGNERVKTVSDIFAQLRKLDRERAEILNGIMGNNRISIIINQARGPEDETIGPAMKSACYDYFGLEIGHIGDISYEDCVGDSIRSKRPLIIDYKHTRAAAEIETCFNNLMGQRRSGGMRLSESQGSSIK